SQPDQRRHPAPVPRHPEAHRLRHRRQRRPEELRRPRSRHRAYARLRGDADRGADPGHRQLRAEPLMHHLLAAMTWDPEIRGYLIVLVALLAFPGSVYLLLAT